MPKAEQLDNKGNRTGLVRHFSDGVWFKLSRLKNCKWVLCENDTPKISHAKPVPVIISDFPEKREDQFNWVTNQTNIKKLEAALKAVNSLALKQTIKDRIEEINKQATNK